MKRKERVLKSHYFLAASSFFFLLFRTMKTRAKRTIVGRNGAITSIMPSMMSPPRIVSDFGNALPLLIYNCSWAAGPERSGHLE